MTIAFAFIVESRGEGTPACTSPPGLLPRTGEGTQCDSALGRPSGPCFQPSWPPCPVTLLGAATSTLHFRVRTSDKLGGGLPDNLRGPACRERCAFPTSPRASSHRTAALFHFIDGPLGITGGGSRWRGARGGWRAGGRETGRLAPSPRGRLDKSGDRFRCHDLVGGGCSAPQGPGRPMSESQPDANVHRFEVGKPA